MKPKQSILLFTEYTVRIYKCVDYESADMAPVTTGSTSACAILMFRKSSKGCKITCFNYQVFLPSLSFTYIRPSDDHEDFSTFTYVVLRCEQDLVSAGSETFVDKRVRPIILWRKRHTCRYMWQI